MTDLPPLSPTSRRILKEIEHLERRSPERAALRLGRVRFKPFEATLDTEPPELTKIDPDPAGMQRVKVTLEPREMERPARVEDDLERCTPQFFLRNTWRQEKYADPNDIEVDYQILRETTDVQSYLDDARRCAFQAGEKHPVLTSEEMRVSVAHRRVLMVETQWHQIFGRGEPVAEPANPQNDSTF